MPGINTNKLLEMIARGEQQARQASQQQFKDLLASISGLGTQVAGTFGEAIGLIGQQRAAGEQRIATQEQQALAGKEQELISRGLGSTTIRQSERRGIKGAAEMQRQELGGRIAGQQAGLLAQRAGAEMGIGQMRAGAISGVTHRGPDMSQMLGLIQQAGRVGGGGGGSRATTTFGARRAGRIFR